MALIFVGVLAGYYIFVYKPHQKEKMVQSVILQQTEQRSFLVLGSKTCNITVEKAKNNKGWLKSLLLKHVVSVQGNVKVFYGLKVENDSLSKNIHYDRKNNCVVVKLGEPQVLTSEIQFPIHYKTESGVIYKAFSEDKEKDINDMLSLLKKNAEDSTKEWLKTQNIQELSEKVSKQIELLTNNKVKVCFR